MHEPCTPSSGLRLIYLGISGVLHPSRSLYKLLYARQLEDDGHAEYEAVPFLAQALDRWPDVRVVLTSTQPWKYGLARTLKRLGPPLASRVVGFTHEDLTTKLRRGKFQLPMSDADYWRCNKSDIVRAHVEWVGPTAWMAIDDESILWTDEERRDNLVQVHGARGLLEPAVRDRLLTVLEGNFGPPVSSRR